jgi:hypothetical protein
MFTPPTKTYKNTVTNEKKQQQIDGDGSHLKHLVSSLFYLSIGRVVKSLNQLHHCALAASTGPHHTYPLTSTHFKVKTFQNLHNNLNHVIGHMTST